MAKKIRKRRTSISRVVFLLVLPWLVLGILSAFVFTLGGSEVLAVSVGLLGSLGVMVLTRRYLPRGRPKNPESS